MLQKSSNSIQNAPYISSVTATSRMIQTTQVRHVRFVWNHRGDPIPDSIAHEHDLTAKPMNTNWLSPWSGKPRPFGESVWTWAELPIGFDLCCALLCEFFLYIPNLTIHVPNSYIHAFTPLLILLYNHSIHFMVWLWTGSSTSPNCLSFSLKQSDRLDDKRVHPELQTTPQKGKRISISRQKFDLRRFSKSPSF